jgi:hypothetical protein
MTKPTGKPPRGDPMEGTDSSTTPRVLKETCKAQHKAIEQWQDLHVKQDDERFDLFRSDRTEITDEIKAVETRLGGKIADQNGRVWSKVDSLCKKIDTEVLPKLALVDKTGAVSAMKNETRWSIFAKVLGVILATGSVGGAVVVGLLKLLGMGISQAPPL